MLFRGLDVAMSPERMILKHLRDCARRCMRHWEEGAPVAFAALLFLLGIVPVAAPFPVSDDQTGLPIGGHRSYLSNLGNLAFNSPNILGDVGRGLVALCLLLALTSLGATAELSRAAGLHGRQTVDSPHSNLRSH
jgi:hypothetical protein